MKDLVKRKNPEDAEAASEILRWAENNNVRLWWGKGARDGSFFPMVDVPDSQRWTISVWTYGRVEIQFQYLKEYPPFDKHSVREELARRLNELPGITIPPNKLDQRPSFSISVLTSQEAMKQFLAILDWIVQEQRGQ